MVSLRNIEIGNEVVSIADTDSRAGNKAYGCFKEIKMNSIEFGKKCRPYNVQYRDVFGYVPCRDDYNCSQGEYFQALLKAIKTKCELSAIVPKKNKEFQEPGKRY